MALSHLFRRWPLVRQAGPDKLGLGAAVRSAGTEALRPRTAGAEHVVQSVCPYCAVGCGQLVYVRNGKVDQIEGDPDSPISRGRLCPKGAASKSLVTSSLRELHVKYRPPYGSDWQRLSIEEAMDMIADRVIASRHDTWESTTTAENGEQLKLNRTLGVGSLGGATLDNEENYLLKKLFTGLGIVSVENQARI